jgi:hypothetical protein
MEIPYLTPKVFVLAANSPRRVGSYKNVFFHHGPYISRPQKWHGSVQLKSGANAGLFRSQPSDLNFKGRFIASYTQHTTGNTPTFNWSDVVEEFTARDLTYQKNRLVALSGIAETMSSASPQTDYESIL